LTLRVPAESMVLMLGVACVTVNGSLVQSLTMRWLLPSPLYVAVMVCDPLLSVLVLQVNFPVDEPLTVAHPVMARPLSVKVVVPAAVPP